VMSPNKGRSFVEMRRRARLKGLLW
jgi:hypothetical protein